MVQWFVKILVLNILTHLRLFLSPTSVTSTRGWKRYQEDEIMIFQYLKWLKSQYLVLFKNREKSVAVQRWDRQLEENRHGRDAQEAPHLHRGEHGQKIVSWLSFTFCLIYVLYCIYDLLYSCRPVYLYFAISSFYSYK